MDLPVYSFVRPVVVGDYLPPRSFSIPALAAYGTLAGIRAVLRKRTTQGMILESPDSGAAITDDSAWVFSIGDIVIDPTMGAGEWTAQVELTDNLGRKHTYFAITLTLLPDKT